MKIRTIMVSFLAVVQIGCASTGPPERVATKTSTPILVDATADNAQVLRDLVPALIATIEIDRDQVSLKDARVLMVPKHPPRKHEEGDMVKLIGLRGGERVHSVLIPDQRLNVQEGNGLVFLEKRTLTGVLPLAQSIDTLEVQPPGDAPAKQFDVRDHIQSFCKTYSTPSLCGPD